MGLSEIMIQMAFRKYCLAGENEHWYETKPQEWHIISALKTQPKSKRKEKTEGTTQRGKKPSIDSLGQKIKTKADLYILMKMIPHYCITPKTNGLALTFIRNCSFLSTCCFLNKRSLNIVQTNTIQNVVDQESTQATAAFSALGLVAFALQPVTGGSTKGEGRRTQFCYLSYWPHSSPFLSKYSVPIWSQTAADGTANGPLWQGVRSLTRVLRPFLETLSLPPSCVCLAFYNMHHQPQLPRVKPILSRTVVRFSTKSNCSPNKGGIGCRVSSLVQQQEGSFSQLLWARH